MLSLTETVCLDKLRRLRSRDERCSMLGPPSEPDRRTADRSGGAAAPGAPRWVKLFAAGAVVLILLLAIMLFVGGGEHGPGRHVASGEGPAFALRATFEP